MTDEELSYLDDVLCPSWNDGNGASRSDVIRDCLFG